jgi:hypothetical protein
MNKFESMSFRKDFVLPVEEQDRLLGFIKWGKKNDYPYFLVDLYNGSAWHQGIIKNKTHYIAGGGLEVVTGNLERFLNNSYSDFTMDEIVEHLYFIIKTQLRRQGKNMEYILSLFIKVD